MIQGPLAETCGQLAEVWRAAGGAGGGAGGKLAGVWREAQASSISELVGGVLASRALAGVWRSAGGKFAAVAAASGQISGDIMGASLSRSGSCVMVPELGPLRLKPLTKFQLLIASISRF
ncbi:MAG: hypothetical protein CMJ95_12885 [Planctomycetes bacterium]|nr:hypothetical protein [Planctomycetota bacterium]